MSLSFENNNFAADNTAKKSEISVLNVLFCLMVIFIHTTSYPLANLSAGTAAAKVLHLFWRMSSCAVYGFIFLSGEKLFLKPQNCFSLKKFYVSRLKKIVLPYAAAVCFYYLFEVYRGYYNFSLVRLANFLISGKVECHLYFVVIIVQFYLLMPLWRRLLEFKKFGALLFLCFSANVLCVYFVPVVFLGFEYNDRVFTSYLFFWVLGCLCGKNYQRFLNLTKKYRAVILLFFAAFLCADVWLSYLCKFGIYHKITEFVHLLYCFAAILFFYVLANSSLKNKITQNRLFKKINGVSYQIYLAHIYFLYKANDLITRLNIGGELWAWIFRMFFVCVSTFLFCIIYKYAVKKLSDVLSAKKYKY